MAGNWSGLLSYQIRGLYGRDQNITKNIIQVSIWINVALRVWNSITD